MSPSRTANPAPRRALRKADDAGIHPATTRPTVLAPVAEPGALVPVASPREPEPAPLPDGGAGSTPAPSGRKPKKRKAADAQQAASSTDPDRSIGEERTDEDAKSSGAKRPTSARTPTGVSAWDKRFHGTTSDVLVAQHTTHDLLRGAEGVLEVKVPKRLRKAARLEAERRDLTIDKVVTRLLADWIEST